MAMTMTKKKKKIMYVILGIIAAAVAIPILGSSYKSGNGQMKDLTGVVRTGPWSVKLDNGDGNFWVGRIGLFGSTINWKLTGTNQTDVWTKA